MTSLTTVHHFSAFIDPTVGSCVWVGDKDRGSWVIMSPLASSLLLCVPELTRIISTWTYQPPNNTRKVIPLKRIGHSVSALPHLISSSK